MSTNIVDVQYFSDVLCIWAYVAEARLDELRAQYANKINISYHFVSVYGNTQKRALENWADRGGVPAYIKYVRGVADDFGHVTVSDQFWANENGPQSSASIHLFLLAVADLVKAGLLESKPQAKYKGKTVFEELVWQCRKHYFSKGENIGLLQTQLQLAQGLNIDTDAIRERLDNGSAFAAMCEDNELKEKYRIQGSPTYVLNEGRQILYGNVGYKIIAANIDELLNRPHGLASWC
jgi:predicted DsbA family dithiol-disulfide isomerase